MMAPVLVTGATGFLGQALLRRLRDEALPVIGQGRDPQRCALLRAAGFRILEHDLTAPTKPEQTRALGEVSAVVHCAARSAPHGTAKAFEAANVTATRNAMALGRSLGMTRFVFISSSSVCFAPADQLGVRESDPLPAPFNTYAMSKQRAERLVRAELGSTAIILRPRGIYGPGDTALLPRLLRAARRGPLPLLRGGRARIDLTHVDDVVEAILAALRAGDMAGGQTYNVSGGEVLPITDIVTRACARAGLLPRWRRMPLAPVMAVAGLAEAVTRLLPHAPEPVVTRYGLALFAYAQSLDLTQARSGLGWQPRLSFEQGLDLTFPAGVAE